MNGTLQTSTGRSPKAITRLSHGSSNSAARRHAVAVCVTLGLLSLMVSCRPDQTALVIPADRTVERQADGRYLVTAAWLQERYELERALQLALDKCEAAPAQQSSVWIRPADREFLIRAEEQVKMMRILGDLMHP